MAQGASKLGRKWVAFETATKLMDILAALPDQEMGLAAYDLVGLCYERVRRENDETTPSSLAQQAINDAASIAEMFPAGDELGDVTQFLREAAKRG